MNGKTRTSFPPVFSFPSPLHSTFSFLFSLLSNTPNYCHTTLQLIWKITFQLSLMIFLPKIELFHYLLSNTKFSLTLKEPKISNLLEIGEMFQILFLEEESTAGKSGNQFDHIASKRLKIKYV